MCTECALDTYIYMKRLYFMHILFVGFFEKEEEGGGGETSFFYLFF